jgi:hypothetical protein
MRDESWDVADAVKERNSQQDTAGLKEKQSKKWIFFVARQSDARLVGYVRGGAVPKEVSVGETRAWRH